MGDLIAGGLASIFGVGALASVLGFILQFALIAGAVYLVLVFLRARRQPAYAHGSARGSGQVSWLDMLSRQSWGCGWRLDRGVDDWQERPRDVRKASW